MTLRGKSSTIEIRAHVYDPENPEAGPWADVVVRLEDGPALDRRPVLEIVHHAEGVAIFKAPLDQLAYQLCFTEPKLGQWVTR